MSNILDVKILLQIRTPHPHEEYTVTSHKTTLIGNYNNHVDFKNHT